MPQHEVNLVATEAIFVGLSKQNLLFHQCVNELCDNSLAAAEKDIKAIIDVIFVQDSNSSESFDLCVCDNGRGMGLEELMQALQLGSPPTSDSRLNEHGFGLKNALATLSGGNRGWQVWSKKKGKKKVVSVKGPFKATMLINDDDEFPTDSFVPADCSTMVKVNVKIAFARTVQGRGAPTSNLNTLRSWLIEHLGVSYRGFLQLNHDTQETSAKITVSIGTDRKFVPPVDVPLGNAKIERFNVELGGEQYPLEYRFGTLDEVKRDSLIHGEKAKFYYQKNISTQGIDIRLGNRVIATRQFESIWKTDDGKSQLTRHNNYNDFVGELLIPETPRGILTTVNNKTDFNLDDPEWIKIFEKLNEIRPEKKVREKTEASLKTKWMSMLKATNPEDEVSDEYKVWPTGTSIDVLRKKADGTIIIYEIKVGSGTPQHLYQLKMYWDGLLIQKIQPKEAVLLVENYSTALESMANLMNKLPTPKIDGQEHLSYNFRIEKHKDRELE